MSFLAKEIRPGNASMELAELCLHERHRQSDLSYKRPWWPPFSLIEQVRDPGESLWSEQVRGHVP